MVWSPASISILQILGLRLGKVVTNIAFCNLFLQSKIEKFHGDGEPNGRSESSEWTFSFPYQLSFFWKKYIFQCVFHRFLKVTFSDSHHNLKRRNLVGHDLREKPSEPPRWVNCPVYAKRRAFFDHKITTNKNVYRTSIFWIWESGESRNTLIS